jgi:PAS domain S-box-containing protein
VSWSPTLEAIHGLSPGSFGGTFEDYLSDVHPEDLVAVKQAIVGSLEERTGHDIEYRIVWPDGSLHWIQGKGRVVLDASGNTVGMTGVCMDITIRKRAEEEIRAANAALLRSNEDLERFAFVASHDLQEPLRMISAYAQLLVKEYPGLFQGDAAAFVGNIIEGAKRIRELLVDLLAYAEIRGASQGPLEVVDLNLVVENVKLTLKTAVDESGAVINSDRLPVLRGHAGHFVPLFQNLIGNALKYRSERPPWIDVSVQEQDGQLRFSVADNGIGIAEEFHDKIFVVFKRLHGRDIPGTGIGLAICQRVVERYGGRIWVESQVGRGSTFFFTIPIRASVSRGEN